MLIKQDALSASLPRGTFRRGHTIFEAAAAKEWWVWWRGRGHGHPASHNLLGHLAVGRADRRPYAASELVGIWVVMTIVHLAAIRVLQHFAVYAVHLPCSARNTSDGIAPVTSF